MKVPAMMKALLEIYLQKRVSRSAAAMSYFLLLTVFPLLICLNAMLGSLFPTTERFYAFAGGLLPQETMEILSEYLRYIGNNAGKNMLAAGLALMLTSSAAVFRVVHNIMADLRGRPRFRGIYSLPLSFVFSLVFLFAVYFSVLVVLLGDRLLGSFAEALHLSNPGGLWKTMRFPLLFLILLTMFWGLYRITAPREERNAQLPGALAAAAGVELLSALFSLFIGMSAKYALVYGSLASLIVLAVWLYLCCTIVIMGSALNVLLAGKGRAGKKSGKTW